MNKRIYFILLPILALLFSFSGRADDAVLYLPVSEFSITGVSLQNHIPHSFSLTKDDNHKKQNKIRIKARDDYSAIDVVEPRIQLSPIYYYNKPTCRVCTVYFLSVHHPKHNLRGPPPNNC